MKKKISVALFTFFFLFIGGTSFSIAGSLPSKNADRMKQHSNASSKKNTVKLPNVFFTKNLSSEGLMAVYKALGRKAEGKVAVKISTGEPGGNNYLHPELIKDFVQSVNGTIVECNTAYGGKRSSTASHKQVTIDHGFTEIAPVDIMDEDGEMELPIKNGRHLNVNYVGSHLANYDSLLILSHFKGHQMGGFGGALKNISIGIASTKGKIWIHTAGSTNKTDAGDVFFSTPQDSFLESMAEAASSIIDYRKDSIVFINVMRDLSIDCDCNAHPKDPEMKDIGILASLDPVALDQACVDLVYKSADPGKASLIQRMEEKHGIHTVEEAARLGVGSRDYELIDID